MAPLRVATRRKERSATKASYKEDSDSAGSGGSGSDGEFEVAKPASAKKKAPGSAAKKAQRGSPARSSRGKGAESEDEEGPQSSGSEHEDGSPKAPKAKKGGRKKVQSSLAKKGKFSSAPRAKPKPKPKEAPADKDDTLLDVAAGKPNSHAGVLSGWWADHADAGKKEAAVHSLVGLLLEASGLQQSLDPALFVEAEDVDIDNEVIQLAEQWASEGSKENFVSKKGKTYQKPRKNFEGFFRKFVELAPRESLSALTEESYCTWMFSLSSSKSPGLRQVSTLAGLSMLVGFAQVAGDVLLEISSKERQKQAAGAASSNAAKEKVKRLSEELDGLGETKGVLEREMDRLFNCFFVHRKGDTNSEIRTMCVEALGEVVLVYSSKFLDNQYTKYLGWPLNDKSDDVRGAALNAIHDIFSESHTKELDMFVERFKGRMVQMVTDVKPAVAAKAFKICTLLAKIDALKEDSLVRLYEEIKCDEEQVRNAAAAFIDEVYVSGDLLKPYEETLENTSLKIDKDTFFLKGMVELLHIAVGESVEDYREIVQSLSACSIDWGYKKWTLMCDILMDDEDEDKLTEEQRETLVKILIGSLNCLASSDKGEETKAGASLELLPHVLKMLKKWSTSPVLVSLVMRLVASFDLSDLTSRQLKTATGIVTAAQDALSKGHDEGLMREACAVLELFHNSTYQIKDMVMPTCSAFLDELAAHLKAVGDALRAGTKLSATQSLWLARVCMLGNCVDLRAANSTTWSVTINMLENIGADGEAEVPALEAALVCIIGAQSIFWRVSACLVGEADPGTRALQMKDIVDDRNLLINSYEGIIGGTAHPFALRMQAAIGLCDMAQIFGKPLAGSRMLGAEDEMDVAEAMLEVGRLAEADNFVAETSMAPIPKPGKWHNILKMNDAGFPDEELGDRHNLVKVIAMCCSKVLTFWRPIEEDQDDMAVGSSFMATASTFTQFSPAYKKELLDLVRDELTILEDFSTAYSAEFWLSAHQSMYLRVLEAQSRGLDVMTYSMNMVEEISALELDSETALHYLSKALEWAIDGVAKNHAPFLEAVQHKMASLSEPHARDLLDRLDMLCSSGEIVLDGDARANKIAHFRDALVALLEGDAASEMPSEASRGGSARARAPRKRPARTPDADTDDGASVSSAASHKKRSGAGGGKRKPKRKARALEFDGIDPADVDEDGFVATKRNRA